MVFCLLSNRVNLAQLFLSDVSPVIPKHSTIKNLSRLNQFQKAKLVLRNLDRQVLRIFYFVLAWNSDRRNDSKERLALFLRNI